jgi:hypothetical protein
MKVTKSSKCDAEFGVVYLFSERKSRAFIFLAETAAIKIKCYGKCLHNSITIITQCDEDKSEDKR